MLLYYSIITGIIIC